MAGIISNFIQNRKLINDIPIAREILEIITSQQNIENLNIFI